MKTPEEVAAEAVRVEKDFHGSHRVFMGEFCLDCRFLLKQAEAYADFARCELAKIIAADREQRELEAIAKMVEPISYEAAQRIVANSLPMHEWPDEVELDGDK